tara:strand:- start:1503 stop:1772 length:270 start_codon:yes stop_codon:yes gene_type:complete
MIINCIDCEFHRVINDPDPHDSFCRDDLAVVCTKMKNEKQDNNSIYAADRQEYAIITCSCRPYNIIKESERPESCPLDKEKIRDKVNEF